MNFLFIGAHFDDIEIGCGGTVAKLVAMGHSVSAIVVTHSGYYGLNHEIVRDKNIARCEGLKALNILGITNIFELNYETGSVIYEKKLIYDLERLSIAIEPDVIFTHWTGDVHQDHYAVGKATLNVCRKSKSVLQYRSNWYKSDTIFQGSLLVDISAYHGVKIRAIKEHKSEVEKFGKNWINFITNEDSVAGMEIGVEYAEAFMPIKYELYKK